MVNARLHRQPAERRTRGVRLQRSPSHLPAELRASHDRRAAHVAELGEPWINYMEPAELHAKLRAIGFAEVEDLGPPQIAMRYSPNRAAPTPDRGGHILRASK